MDKALLDHVGDDVGARGAPAFGPRHRVVLHGASENCGGLPDPVAEVRGIREVGQKDAERGTRALLLSVRAVLVRDAEVVGPFRRIARRYARSVPGQRVAPLEIFVRDLLEGRARAKLHQHAAVAVPPSKAWDLGVVAVQDPRLRERRGRRYAAPIWMDLIALAVEQLPHKRHAAIVDGPAQRAGAEAVDMQDNQFAAQNSANTGR